MASFVSQTLDLVPLFAGLSLSQWDEIHPLLTEQCQTVLMALDGCCHRIYIVVDGTVEVSIWRPDGAETTLVILGPGEVLGELSAVDGLPHSATVRVLEATRTLSLDSEAFVLLLKTVPLLSFNLNRILVRRLRRLTGHAEALATLSVRERLIFHLLRLAEDYGEPLPGGETLLPLQLTQSVLARLVGTSREDVNRALQNLVRQGLVASQVNGHLVLPNVRLLAQKRG